MLVQGGGNAEFYGFSLSLSSFSLAQSGNARLKLIIFLFDNFLINKLRLFDSQVFDCA